MYENLFDCNKQANMRSFFLNSFSKHGENRHFNKNEEIKISCKRFIAVVTKGKIKRTIFNNNGIEKSLYFLIPGEIFGEEEYFEGCENTILAIAQEDSEISILNEENIEKLLNSNPEIYKFIIHSIMRKYRIALMQMTNMCFNDSTQKIADFLVRLCIQFQTTKPQREDIELKLTHQEIADLVGCSRITVTKALNELKNRDLIDLKNKGIFIKSIDTLEKFCPPSIL